MLHQHIAQWVLQNRPNYFEVLGPWKDFVRSLESDTDLQITQKASCN